MNIFKAYFTGLRKTAVMPRPVIVIYLVNLLIGILVALPFMSVLESSLGDSKIAGDILKFADTNIVSDFINQNKQAILNLMSQVKYVLIVYWILSVFLSGGIIRTINQDKFTMSSFFSGSGFNFFRFLGIGITMLVIQILLFLTIYFPLYLIISSVSGGVESENTLFRIFLIGFFLHGILFLIISMVSDYAKFHSVLYDSRNFLKSVGGGFKYVFKNFGRTFSLYILLVILPLALFVLYFYVDSLTDTTTKYGILLMFGIQQLFILLRVWFRVWIYASPLKMYTADFLKRDTIKSKLAVMEEWQKKAKEQEIIQAASSFESKEKIVSEDEILKQEEI